MLERGLSSFFVCGHVSPNPSESKMQRFLQENGIGYIRAGRVSQDMRGSFPAHSKLFRPWFRGDFVSIYEVVGGSETPSTLTGKHPDV